MTRPPRPPSPLRYGNLATLHWLHWLVLTLSIGVTVVAYVLTKGHAEAKLQGRFHKQSSQVVELVVERMQRYEDALWAGVSTIHSLGGEVTQSQWRKFSNSMQLGKKYPGINGIGVIYRLTEDTLPGYLENKRLERPGYNIHPPHTQSEFWPITYIEPEASNLKAIGLDMAHESSRFTAALSAQVSGQAQITGPIVLVQDAQKTPGFLFYAPIYPGEDAPAGQDSEHSAALVYAPFVVSRLMEGTLERSNRHVGVSIADGTTRIYDEHHQGDPNFDPKPQFIERVNVELYGRTWRFDLRSDKTFRSASTDSQPLTILIGGATIDLLLLLLFLGMSRSNRHAVAYAESVTQELRAGKEQLERVNTDLIAQRRTLEDARREAEAARRAAEAAARAKSAFLATMSHEIRTPMNGVIATAELLLDAEPDERKPLTETIISSGQTLLALINDILDFSKLDAGKVELDPVPTELRPLVGEIVTLLSPQIEAHGVRISVQVGEDVPQWLSVDALRLRQVVLNLCSNAVKFTNGGSVDIACALTSRAGSAYRLRFSVADTGIGIADPSVLFEEFTQADASTTRRFGGTGLGLTISKSLVELMGGSLGVTSELGKGSTFFFELELEEADAVESAAISSLPRAPADSHGKALVVDDNAVNRMVAEKLLHRMGWEATVVDNGADAVELAAEISFDLIFMDCQMPDMDGFETTERILERCPRPAPIIALTANAQSEDRERCLAAGMSDHLAKPVRAAALRAVVQRWSATNG